ncbi:MAG TPA: branched-chain amino acid ABC transporter permease [Alicyclobacillus sp.]|nr:branched-chain amino acid ABC transporter permease [Alicyclobacillus sp.]
MKEGVKRWLGVAVAVLCVGASLYVQNLYILNVLILAVISAVLAVSVNLLVGYTGQMSLGQAGFYGIGAYTVAVLTTTYQWGYWPSFVMACLIPAVAGFLLGLPTTRLRGHFLAIATLGFGVIANVVLNNWTALTNGPSGIRGIPSPELFGVSLQYPNFFLAFALACLALIVGLVDILVRSSIGRAWKCIRGDEISALTSGIHVHRYKLLVFSLSGAIAGLAGALYAGAINFVSPDVFDLNQSIMILITAIIGGVGTLFGPLVGAALLSFIGELLRSLGGLRLVIFGALLVAVIVFMPEGVYPVLFKGFRRNRLPVSKARARRPAA